jgi:crotonobetainyl-CoA:carnitine CoA-transferase CaiB-like acyl-CoA transferase
VIAVFAERQWQALVEQMGSPGWAREGRFASAERRQAHRSELDRRIGEWTVLHAAEEIAFRLQQAAVPAGVVQDAADLAKDPHLRARGFFVPLDHPVLGTTVADASPIRFCGGSAPQWKAAPLLGEANRDVFCGLLGLSDAEFARLVEDGVIG